MAAWDRMPGVVPSTDGTRWVRLGGTWVQVVSRKEFLAEMWDYEPGDHVMIIGPTQSAGKTTLLFDLLEATDTSWCKVPPTMLVAKPRDKVVERGIQRLGWQETQQWPPRKPWQFWKPLPPGYAFWPPHMRGVDPAVNAKHLAGHFTKAVDDLFWEDRTILVADELYYLMLAHDMRGHVDRHLTQGMGMESGLWSGTQKPSGTQQAAFSGFVYNSAVHTFLGRDPVESNQRKFDDIGGVKRGILSDAADIMPAYHFCYIHRSGPRICIIEPE